MIVERRRFRMLGGWDLSNLISPLLQKQFSIAVDKS